MRNNTFLCFIATWLAAAGPSLAADATLTLVPVGGTTVTGGDIVAVEAFVTTSRTIRFEGTQWDVPCTVAAEPGGSGSLTSLGGCADCDGNGTNTSTGGIAFLFGATGLSPHAPSSCITATTPGPGQPTVVVNAGQTRYLGTIRYQVPDCAAGSFNVFFECTDQPGGVCDDIPEATNTTRYREDEPVAPGQGPLLSLDMVGVTLTVVDFGSCCTSAGGCIDDGVTESCCLNSLGGDHWHAGLLCSDPETCHGHAGTGFTYQGFLEKPAGTALTDTCTFEFKLCDNAAGTCAPATISNHPGISVNKGVFTVHGVDFGEGAFLGTARWMDVYVQCTGDGGLVALSPRVELTPAPYAMRALNGVGPLDTIEIDSVTGYVGIGTSAPTELLHVAGDAKIDGTVTATSFSSASPLLLQTAGATRIFANDVTGNVGVGTTTPTNKLDVEGAAVIGATYSGTSVAPANGLLVEGNVGIGTTAPGAELHVRGDDAVGGIIVTPGTSDSVSEIRMTENVSASLGSIIRYDGVSNLWQVLGLTTGGVETAAHLVIRRDEPSRVGIGRTPVTNALEVSGNASKDVAGDWLANSDKAIKKQVRTITNALSIIDQLRPVAFQYTDAYRAKHPSVKDQPYYNYIAQEFREVFPDSVQDSGEDGLLQMDAYPAGVYSVAAIQELHQIVQEKDCEIDELRELSSRENRDLRERNGREMTDLRSEISELKAMVDTLAAQSAGGGR